MSSLLAKSTWVIARCKDAADTSKLATLSDFGKYVVDGSTIVLAALAESVNLAVAMSTL